MKSFSYTMAIPRLLVVQFTAIALLVTSVAAVRVKETCDIFHSGSSQGLAARGAAADVGGPSQNESKAPSSLSDPLFWKYAKPVILRKFPYLTIGRTYRVAAWAMGAKETEAGSAYGDEQRKQFLTEVFGENMKAAALAAFGPGTFFNIVELGFKKVLESDEFKLGVEHYIAVNTEVEDISSISKEQWLLAFRQGLVEIGGPSEAAYGEALAEGTHRPRHKRKDRGNKEKKDGKKEKKMGKGNKK